ncbi:MAG: carbohydrate binding family 9 domain-containing protein, partial [Acidobacteria bacterium]|nr:carbohydrate binding family 9 domain-containing protein [Acidobacteriota bacterium]
MTRAQTSAVAAHDSQTASGAGTTADTPPAAGNASGSLTLAAPGPAEAVPSAGVLSNRPNVVVPLTSVPPTIDGRLDDAIWPRSAHLDTFVQQRPRENAPATEQTDIYIAYDDRNIYFGIYAHYSDVESMRVNRSERDRVGRDDTVSVIFDPFLDQQRAYVFTVNGYGVQADSLMGGGGRGGGGGPGGGGPGGGPGGELGDRSWNALFDSAGTPVRDGWTAELAIPFKSLRYPSRGRGEGHRWGFQIQRDLQTKNETVVWSPVLRSVASFLGQMGTMDGLTNLSTSRNLEFQPTFTAVRQDELDTTTGVTTPSNLPEAGLNVKYGLTSNLTADFTLNPDFSQIESDQPQ